jgi:hypothetical protein
MDALACATAVESSSADSSTVTLIRTPAQEAGRKTTILQHRLTRALVMLGFGGKQRAVIEAMADKINRKDYLETSEAEAWPAVARLAALVGCGERTVRYARKLAITGKIISPVSSRLGGRGARGGESTTTRYAFNVERINALAAEYDARAELPLFKPQPPVRLESDAKPATHCPPRTAAGCPPKGAKDCPRSEGDRSETDIEMPEEDARAKQKPCQVEPEDSAGLKNESRASSFRPLGAAGWRARADYRDNRDKAARATRWREKLCAFAAEHFPQEAGVILEGLAEMQEGRKPAAAIKRRIDSLSDRMHEAEKAYGWRPIGNREQPALTDHQYLVQTFRRRLGGFGYPR